MNCGGLESPIRISWLALKIVVHSVMSNSATSRIAACHTRLPCPSLSPRICSNSCLLSQWCHPTISSSVIPFSSCPVFPNMSLLQWVNSLHQVEKVLEVQHQSFQWIFKTDFLWNWLVGSPCSPRNSQESSPTPQFFSAHLFFMVQRINSSALSFLYGPTLIYIHDYWKKPQLWLDGPLFAK